MLAHSNPNRNPYEIPVGVPPSDVTGVKWLKKHDTVSWVGAIRFASTREDRAVLFSRDKSKEACRKGGGEKSLCLVTPDPSCV